MVLGGLRPSWKLAQMGSQTKHTPSKYWRGRTTIMAGCSLAWWCTISISCPGRSSCCRSPYHRQPRHSSWRRSWRTASFWWSEKLVWLLSIRLWLCKPFAFGTYFPKGCWHCLLISCSSRNTWWGCFRKDTSWLHSPTSFASQWPPSSPHALHCSPFGSEWSLNWRIYSLGQLGESSHWRMTLVGLGHSISRDPSCCHLSRLLYFFFLQVSYFCWWQLIYSCWMML